MKTTTKTTSQLETAAALALAALHLQLVEIDDRRITEGATTPQVIGPGAVKAIRGEYDRIRTTTPQALGLDPLPTPPDRARRELLADIARMEAQIVALRDRANLPDNKSMNLVFDRRIEAIRESIKALKGQLNQL